MSTKLSLEAIKNFLSAHTPFDSEFQILIEDTIASTNDRLLEMVSQANSPLPRTALLAEMQTAGRGRQGRTWVSVPGNILLSVYWPFYCQFDKLYGLSLVVGIAIARVLQKNGLQDVQLKWPNDIYWQNRKMGGILIETKQHQGRIDAIIGIGLNIVDMDAYSAQINQKFVSLENALQHKVYRDKLVGQLLIELDQILAKFMQNGFNAFIDEWKTLDAKLPSSSSEEDLFAKIIHADKTKIDGKFLH